MIYVDFTEYLWTENRAPHRPPSYLPLALCHVTLADMREQTLWIGKLIPREKQQKKTVSKLRAIVVLFGSFNDAAACARLGLFLWSDVGSVRLLMAWRK